jgi:hypothetical protein
MSPSLYSTTIYFPTFHFISPHFNDAPINLALFITYLTLFLKFLGLQERSVKHLQAVGSRAVWSYLQRNIFRYLSFAEYTAKKY